VGDAHGTSVGFPSDIEFNFKAIITAG
jgi:hypothetical protein